MQPAISIDNVSKSFGSTVAVRDLDLLVPTGSLCGFLGPNGAGKSTTIRMIMSIIYPDCGSVSVLGGSALAAKDRIGYLPEERGIYRKMRVGEFLEYIGRLKGLSGPALRARVKDWLERVELGHVIRKRCHELSKGMQQKVQFLASILHDPELLIFDEPFSGLDPVNASLLIQLLRELNNEGRTVIFSTHVLQQAEQLCDRIFLIHHGVKLLDATLAEIHEQFNPRTIVVEPLEPSAMNYALPGVVEITSAEQSNKYELHLENYADPHEIMRELTNRWPVRSIELRRLTLEEVFVRLVMQDSGQEEAARAREALSHA